MDALEQLQTDVFWLLDAAQSLQYTTVLMARPRIDPITGLPVLAPDIIQKQQFALAGNLKKNGKTGSAIMVLLPVEEPIEAVHKAQRVPTRQKVTVRVLENTLINMSDQGSGLSAETLAQRVWDQLDEYPFLSGHKLKWTRKAPISASPVIYEMYFERDSDRVHLPRCYPVMHALNGSATRLALWSPTADSVVYYTLDGTFPGITNPNAFAFPILIGDGGEPLVDENTGDFLSGDIAVPGAGVVLTAVAYNYDKGNPSPPFQLTF
jgi:hypothetical protein